MSGNLQKGKESEQMQEMQKIRKAQAAPSKGKRYQAAKSSIKPCWGISRNVKKLNEAKKLMPTGKAPAASRSRQGPPETSKNVKNVNKRQKRK